MHPEIERFTESAHHLDAVSADTALSLRECISNALSWQPTWLKILFLARGGLARLMRLEHPSSRPGRPLRPEEISFHPGDRLALFTVSAGKEHAFLVLTAEDTHLVGHLIVEVDPTDTGTGHRFRIITAVHYRRWTGRLYFNIIRPFHHLIMHRMIAAATRPDSVPSYRRLRGRGTFGVIRMSRRGPLTSPAPGTVPESGGERCQHY